MEYAWLKGYCFGKVRGKDEDNNVIWYVQEAITT